MSFDWGTWGPIIAAGVGAGAGLLGGGDNQQDVTTTTELPPWAQEAMQWNIGQGQQYAQRPYVPYQGDRFAPYNPLQQNAYASSDLFGQMGLGALGHSYNALTDVTGQNMMGQAFGGLAGFMGDLSNMDPVTAQRVQAAQGRASTAQAQLADRGNIRDIFGGSYLDMDIQDYMNPFTQTVIQDTTNEMDRARQIQLQQGNSAAAAAGAFGGSRHGVQDSLTNAEFFRNQGNMANQMNLQAYQAATGLMGDDLARALQASMSNQGMDWNVENLNANLGTQTNQYNAGLLTNTSLQNAGMKNQVGLANAANALQAAGLNQSQMGLGLSALQSMGNLGMNLGNLGLAQGQALGNFGLQGLGAQQGAGDRMQAWDQAQRDWDYNQWIEARDWYPNQFQNALAPLQGGNFGSSTTQPYFGPSSWEQGLGGAMMGLGVYNMGWGQDGQQGWWG